VSADRRSISLSDTAADVAALRARSATPRALIHVAQAAEHALRRLLRDDPTAGLELRLQAMDHDELPLDGLLAELRRHDRIPMELAAGMHELAAAAGRAEAGQMDARDTENALAVVDALETRLNRPGGATLEDPLLSPEPEGTPEDPDVVVHEVPPDTPSSPARLLAALIGLAALVALVAWIASRGGSDDPIERADRLSDQGRIAAAGAVLREATARTPVDPRAAIRLSRVFREAGRPADALRALRGALSAEPGDPRLNEELGLVLLEQRRFPEAVRAFRNAISADPASERGYLGLIRALRESGDPGAAQQALARAPEGAKILAGPVPPAPHPAP